MSTSPSHPTINLDELNHRHIHGVDKYFRMYSGAASSLEALTDDLIELRVELFKQRWPDPVERDGIVFAVTKPWRYNKELASYQRLRIRVYMRLAPTGFCCLPDRFRDDPNGELANTITNTIKNPIRQIQELGKLPKPFFAEYTGKFPLVDPSDLKRLPSLPERSETSPFFVILTGSADDVRVFGGNRSREHCERIIKNTRSFAEDAWTKLVEFPSREAALEAYGDALEIASGQLDRDNPPTAGHDSSN